MERQADLDIAAGHATARRIEDEVVGRQHGRTLTGASPDQRANARHELREGERLDEVVVGPGVQPLDAVADVVAGGEHEDRRPSAPGPQLSADGEAVELGEHDVEDDRVVRVLGPRPQPVRPGRRDVDGVPLLLEPALEERGHLRLVLDDEDPHAGSPRGRSLRPIHESQMRSRGGAPMPVTR